jgi:hypothetical protein
LGVIVKKTLYYVVEVQPKATYFMNLYKNDVIAWSIEQAEHLRQGRFNNLDIENVIDEIEDVQFFYKNEFEKELTELLIWLLKWKIQIHFTCDHWKSIINGQREIVGMTLKEIPSLINYKDKILKDAYSDAYLKILNEMGVDLSNKCPWTFEQIIDPDFFPE